MSGEHGALDATESAIASLSSAQEQEPDLDNGAAVLLTFNGYTNALADLAERAKLGADRDENASMNVEVKALKMFAEIHAKLLEHKLDSEGTRKLQELLDRMDRRDSGASTSRGDDWSPPSATPDKGAH